MNSQAALDTLELKTPPQALRGFMFSAGDVVYAALSLTLLSFRKTSLQKRRYISKGYLHIFTIPRGPIIGMYMRFSNSFSPRSCLSCLLFLCCSFNFCLLHFICARDEPQPHRKDAKHSEMCSMFLMFHPKCAYIHQPICLSLEVRQKGRKRLSENKNKKHTAHTKKSADVVWSVRRGVVGIIMILSPSSRMFLSRARRPLVP